MSWGECELESEGFASREDALDYYMKIADDLFDGLSHLNKDGVEWLSRDDVRDSSTLAESYAEAKTAIHMHLRLKTAVVGCDADLRDYCAVFEKASRLQPNLPMTRDALGCDDLELCLIRDERDDGNSAVFVGVGERVEDGEWVRVRRIPSVVRLRLVEACDQVFGDAPEHRRRSRFPILAGSADWEPAILIGVEREFVDQLVESGSQTVDRVSGDDTPLNGGDRLQHLEPEQVLRSLGVRFATDPVEGFSLLSKEPLASLVERIQVLFRPVAS